jgi:hypothetical protein
MRNSTSGSPDAYPTSLFRGRMKDQLNRANKSSNILIKLLIALILPCISICVGGPVMAAVH